MVAQGCPLGWDHPDRAYGAALDDPQELLVCRAGGGTCGSAGGWVAVCLRAG